MSLPRYPKYKDSGVEWLGEVPEHWQVRRLKHVCEAFPSNVDKKSHEGEEPVLLCNYTDVYYSDRITAGLPFMAASASIDQIEKFTLRAGDIIVTKDSETADDIAVSAYVPADLPGVVCGYHLSLVRPRAATSGNFVKRLFDSAYTKATVAVKANGLTRVGLSQYDIDNIEWPWPPPKEQAAIASFLDRETTKIDALIAEQLRLVELLKEKRQAVISQAVTKGLNPGAPMKASGIEWLGDVPAHWRVGKCGYHLSILSGFAFPSIGFTQDESATRLLRGINVGVSRLRWDDTVFWCRTTNDGLDEYVLAPGDLVIGMDRPLIAEGVRVARITADDVPCLLLQRVASLKCSPTLNVDFLQALLSSQMFVAHFEPDTTGVSVPHISPEQIGAFVIPVPPVEEQKAIAARIESESSSLDGLLAEADRAIELLRQRRVAVISSAVTGGADVRSVVAEQFA